MNFKNQHGYTTYVPNHALAREEKIPKTRMSGGRVPIILFPLSLLAFVSYCHLNCRWELDCRKVHFKLECVVYFKNSYTSSAVKAFWQDLYYYWCYYYYYKCQVLEFFWLPAHYIIQSNPLKLWAEHEWKRSVRFQVRREGATLLFSIYYRDLLIGTSVTSHSNEPGLRLVCP